MNQNDNAPPSLKTQSVVSYHPYGLFSKNNSHSLMWRKIQENRNSKYKLTGGCPVSLANGTTAVPPPPPSHETGKFNQVKIKSVSNFNLWTLSCCFNQSLHGNVDLRRANPVVMLKCKVIL